MVNNILKACNKAPRVDIKIDMRVKMSYMDVMDGWM